MNVMHITAVICVCWLLLFSQSGYALAAVRPTGSMNPSIEGCDVVVLNENYDELDVGDVAGYDVPNDDYFLHRVVEIQEVQQETFYFFKGDANDERDMYAVNDASVIGKMVYHTELTGGLC